jgi:uncharacterized membrane protein
MLDIAHVRPMLVHFPIVLFLVSIASAVIVLVQGGDLTQRSWDDVRK